MKHRRPYMLRYVAQIESANAHQKDFFEITFGETRLSENRKIWVVIEFGGKLYGTDGVLISCSGNQQPIQKLRIRFVTNY